MKNGFLFVFLVSAASAALACGGSTDNTTEDGGPDVRGAGHDATADVPPRADVSAQDSPGGTYPAFPADYPQIAKNAGTVMANPVVVTITWPGDVNVSTWEAFGDAIGGSSYWSATTAEYGVGKATSGASNHVRMTQPLPKSISYTDLDDFVSAAVQAAEADAGAPDAGTPDGGAPNPSWPKPMSKGGMNQTIYSLVIPPSTSVTDPGTGASFCTEGGLGYHGNPASGIPITYAVILQCQTLASIEETAAHEYVEAATDPTSEGYFGFDSDHVAWDLYTGLSGDELADACQYWQDSNVEETGTFPYWVQRSWSNKAALLGHDPCVPAPAAPNYGVAVLPSQESTFTLDLSNVFGGSGPTKAAGFGVTLGKPLTFQVGYFSDAARAPWTIAYDFPAQTGLYNATSFNPIGNGSATVKIDTTTGQNGDEATVTVTVAAKGDAGFHVMAITWDPPTQMGFLPHFFPIVLVDQ